MYYDWTRSADSRMLKVYYETYIYNDGSRITFDFSSRGKRLPFR